MDYWFRMEIEGWEKLPEPPALLIGIHSGAPFVWDAWTVGIQWWRRFGTERPLHGTAHDALMAAPVIGDYFRRMGVLPAAPDSIAAALAAGHDVALWPGGEVDSLRTVDRARRGDPRGPQGLHPDGDQRRRPDRPDRDRRRARLDAGAGQRPAPGRALQLDKVARLKMFPIALSAPWGIAPAMLPEIPLPTKIRTAFQDPVEVEHDPERAGDDDYVDEKYEEVRRSIQGGMDALARRRAFPVFG